MMANKLVTCPYDEAHKVKESRFSLHITKCRQNNLNAEKFICSFNASHVLPLMERDYHLQNCPDNTLLRGMTAKALHQNNPFKGNTSVPSYTASVPTTCDEVWDDGLESMEPAPGFVPSKPPPCAIVEPPALSKPAERRKLYQELHKRPAELENNSKPTPVAEPKLQMYSRQPKAPSEVENKTASEFHHLGLGRGKPAVAPSRIAANIFAPTPAPQSAPTSNINYSAALSGMSKLGFGRGYSAAAATQNLEDDFPALGCGRGVYRTPKNDIRYPGSRS
ncbi:gametocyte-specific factor 1 homolog isoform X3 [Parasteatoda tepidariorum]|uniref:gametocyte-specific factor 1 homolog isoform X3 n=2 Tax=Parasteatoda tepidariorum TaxID=114398 RepID=UPI00077FA6F5|nr:gametocyte-specific factor 1 homolog isoform X3 [Parasteatoda tepidariorum]